MANNTTAFDYFHLKLHAVSVFQKQFSNSFLRTTCSENMQQIYRTPIWKCDFSKVAKQV